MSDAREAKIASSRHDSSTAQCTSVTLLVPLLVPRYLDTQRIKSHYSDTACYGGVSGAAAIIVPRYLNTQRMKKKSL